MSILGDDNPTPKNAFAVLALVCAVVILLGQCTKGDREGNPSPTVTTTTGR